jgi:hypothetical protein
MAFSSEIDRKWESWRSSGTLVNYGTENSFVSACYRSREFEVSMVEILLFALLLAFSH